MVMINTRLFLIACSILVISSAFAQQYDTLKIAPPPGGGMYLANTNG